MIKTLDNRSTHKTATLVVALDFIKKDFVRMSGRTGVNREDFDQITNRFLMKFPIVEGMTFDEFKNKYRELEDECREHCLDYQI